MSCIKYAGQEIEMRHRSENFDWDVLRIGSPDRQGNCAVTIDIKLHPGVNLVAEALRLKNECVPGAGSSGAYLAVLELMLEKMSRVQKTIFEEKLAKILTKQTV